MFGRFVLALAVSVGLSVCMLVPQGRAECPLDTPLKVCGQDAFMTVYNVFGERPQCSFKASVMTSTAVEAGGALTSNGGEPWTRVKAGQRYSRQDPH